jgi:prolyl-tRNA editing enzyme YbaK/EbsC (Cys-tRNA(Pro) deacylase)
MANRDEKSQAYEQKLQKFLKNKTAEYQYLQFSTSCHSVHDAAQSVNASISECIKNICMIDSTDKVIVAIVKGDHRASTTRVAKALDISRPRIAQPDEILEITGYPCGGVPAFGFPAVFLIDPKVMENSMVYTSGGSETTLIKISPKDIQRLNHGKIVRVRK